MKKITSLFLITFFTAFTSALFAQDLTAKFVSTEAAKKESANESVSYIKSQMGKMTVPAEKRAAYIFLASLQEQLALYNDAQLSYATAAGISAADAEGMPKCISTKTYNTNKKVKLNQVKYKKVKKSYYKKVPVYKYKKVRTYKWKVKKVLDYETWTYSNGAYYDYDDKSYSTVNKYWNSNKWKYCGSSYKTCSDSYSYIDSFGDYVSYDHTKFYTHFKTKVYYYKKVKYARICAWTR